MTEQIHEEKKHNSFRNLLFFLLLYIFGSPFLAPYPNLAVIAHASLSVALFFSIYAVQKQQSYRSIAMILLLPLLILYWLSIYDIVGYSRQGAYILFALYFGLLVFSFASQIMRSRKITLHIIHATLCLYLIIGLFWGTLYTLLHELSPGAYAGALLENNPDTHLTTFNYFSMVTLTTLGYGDITPQTPGAASLCQLEAIMGQFFTAVVVAWFVGNFVRDRQKQ
jgi:hypothetical protein